MKRFARMLFAGLGIVIAGTAMSLAPHRVATAGGMTAVTVTNPSLAVTQSGPWNVGITGTPNVSVTNTPSVSFANTSATPLFVRDVDNGARHPFTATCSLPFETFQFDVCNILTVPAGEEAVIETESFVASADSSNTLFEAGVQAVGGGLLHTTPVPLQDNGFGQPTESLFELSSSFKLYADPGTLIKCNGATKSANPGGHFTIQCTISGYLVTLP